jgi:hypothetical protein
MRRRTVVAVMLAGVLLAIGCSVGRTPVAAPAVGSDSIAGARAIEMLRAGTSFIDHTSFRLGVSIAGGQIATVAHWDNANKRADVTLTGNGAVTEIRMIDSEIFMKTTMKISGVGDGWMVLDPARIPPTFPLSFAPGMNDPGGTARLFNAIVSAQVSGTNVTGTIDVTKVGTGNGLTFQPGADGKFPDGAQNQAFHATLDVEGRLVAFVIPSANGLPDAFIQYTDFGAPVDVSPPQGAVPAPDALYPQIGLH